MTKTKRKHAITKGPTKTAKRQTKAMEYVNSLFELHRLQGALLNRLSKEV